MADTVNFKRPLLIIILKTKRMPPKIYHSKIFEWHTRSWIVLEYFFRFFSNLENGLHASNERGTGLSVIKKRYTTWSYIKQLQTDTMVSWMKCDPRNYVRKICKTYIISSWRCNIFLFSYIILQNVKVKRKIFVRVKFVFLGNTWNNYFKCSVDPLFTSTLGIRK